jgi:GR25 family glycosyltransferase involved in LPS biosynthesis
MENILLIIIIVLVILNLYYLTKKTLDAFSNNMIDDIDAFIYINLEDREDRKKEILQQFEKLEIPKNKIRKVSGVRIAKNGHKGCIQSHILALQMAKLNNWKTVAIFEDDARLKVSPEVFKEMVNKAMSNKWDIIVLHGANQQEKEKIDDDLYYLKQSTQSTGYIIKSSYYDKLINLFTHCNDMMSKDGW